MFDFEKLEVYSCTRQLVREVLTNIYQQQAELDPDLARQLKTSATNIILHLADGTGKMTNADKRQAFTTARGCVFECVAVLQLMYDLKQIDLDFYQPVYDNLETVSKMLLGMIRSFSH